MGSRGAFVNTDFGDFRFKSNGQTFQMLGWVGDVKVIQRANGLSVKAPEISHTANRIYAVVHDGRLKHIAFYDENHRQIKCIDVMHPHKQYDLHYHVNLNHSDDHTFPATQNDIDLVNKIRKELNIK